MSSVESTPRALTNLDEKENCMRKSLIFLSLILFAFGAEARSAQPIDVLRDGVDQVLKVLKESRSKDKEQRRQQRERLWTVIEKTFDFREMGARSLARYWNDFSEEQKEVFTVLFSKLLGNTYIEKMQTGYHDEKVLYAGQEIITESKAVVKTKVLREGREIPVDYSMLIKNGKWLVYDVHIEGISLIKNYRSQFSAILMKNSPADLIELLKKKVAQVEQVSNTCKSRLIKSKA